MLLYIVMLYCRTTAGLIINNSLLDGADYRNLDDAQWESQFTSFFYAQTSPLFTYSFTTMGFCLPLFGTVRYTVWQARAIIIIIITILLSLLYLLGRWRAPFSRDFTRLHFYNIPVYFCCCYYYYYSFFSPLFRFPYNEEQASSRLPLRSRQPRWQLEILKSRFFPPFIFLSSCTERAFTCCNLRCCLLTNIAYDDSRSRNTHHTVHHVHSP
jgi:hypothetical protein